MLLKTRNILRDKTLKLGEDHYTYTKDFKGKTIEYVMVGTPAKVKPENLGKKFEVLKSKFGNDLPWETLVDLDPTPQKEYLSWLAKIFKNEKIKEEDYYKFSDFLYEFDMGKHKIPLEKRDINKVPSISALFNLIQESNPTKNEISQEKKHEAYQEAKIHFDSPTFKIIEPLTEKASCYFGQGTAWCTAATSSENMFDYYTREGKRLFIFITPKGKFQGHTGGELRDSADGVVNIRKIIDETLVKMLPNDVILDTLSHIDEYFFQYFDTTSVPEEVVIKMISAKPNFFKYLDKQTTEICLVAVSKDHRLLQHVKEQTLEVCMMAVQHDGYALEYVEEQTPEICMAAVQKAGVTLKYVRTQTPELCLAAVRQDGDALRYVKNQTEEICLAAVQQKGYALAYVEKQTPELCLAAVQQNSKALEYVGTQTPELCLVAVQQDGRALEYVDNQTPELCLVAVQQNGIALRSVEKQTPEICLAAVQQNGLALKYVGKQTLELCLAAVQNKQEALEYVQDQFLPQVQEYMKSVE